MNSRERKFLECSESIEDICNSCSTIGPNVVVTIQIEFLSVNSQHFASFLLKLRGGRRKPKIIRMECNSLKKEEFHVWQVH